LKLIIISAVAQNGVIGRSNGEMPWHIKEEFQHFKNTTSGFPVIMGRKTFETLGKPLKGRLNVIVSGKPDYSVAFGEVEIYKNLTEAVESIKKSKPEKIFIIGGGEIYRQAILFVDEMIISVMNFEAEGDVYFPKIDPNIWKIVSQEPREQFEIVTYVKNHS
jgi:dihydrofolate reductase